MADEDVELTADPAGLDESQPAQDSTSSGSGAWTAEAQAEYTKKTQALAQERKQWESQRAEQQGQLQQHAQQLQQQQYARQAAHEQTQHHQQGQASTKGMLDQLRAMPYLDGQTAAALMERMVNEGINPLNAKLQERDKALAKVYQDYKSLRDQVSKSQGKQAASDLDGRFAKIREEQGLPDSEIVHELMRDVYFSHEGDDLDREYPDMLRKRWEGIQKAVRDADRATAKKAKTSPFPSRGGEVSPTSGKTGGYQTPEERANALWPMLNPGATE
jgi:hypothetical protein